MLAAPAAAGWATDGNYHFGDRAKVYAKAAKDGYLIVLRADARGRVWPVFPVDPKDDQHVQGGKKYELKGRGGREAFVVDDTTGRGMVLAAYSATPFRFDQFAKNGHWDTAALSAQGPAYSANVADVAHPEARLLRGPTQYRTDGRVGGVWVTTDAERHSTSDRGCSLRRGYLSGRTSDAGSADNCVT